MERDLAEIRAKRAERERAAGILKPRPLIKESPRNQVEPPLEQASGNEDGDLEDSTKAKDQDVIMLDDAQEVPEVSATVSTPDTKVPTGTTQPQGKPTDETALEQDKPVDKDVPSNPNPTNETSELNRLIDQQVDAPLPVSEPSLETPTTANIRDANFESMFNDTQSAGADDSIDFGIDFGADNNMSQDMLNDNPFGEDFTTMNAASNEDINTLLPGLENYVNAGDFSMIDVPPATSAFSNPTATQITGTTAPTAEMGGGATESSFDDLFFSSGDIGMGGSGTGGDMGGSENLGDFAEFDDQWFKTDGT